MAAEVLYERENGPYHAEPGRQEQCHEPRCARSAGRALREADADPEVWSIILTGGSKVFSTGSTWWNLQVSQEGTPGGYALHGNGCLRGGREQTGHCRRQRFLPRRRVCADHGGGRSTYRIQHGPLRNAGSENRDHARLWDSTDACSPFSAKRCPGDAVAGAQSFRRGCLPLRLRQQGVPRRIARCGGSRRKGRSTK